VKKYLPYAVVMVLTLMAADKLRSLPLLDKLPTL
jgi:hypothetical protein